MNKKLTTVLGATMLAATVLSVQAVNVDAASSNTLNITDNIREGFLKTKPQKVGTGFNLKLGANTGKNNPIKSFKVTENGKSIYNSVPNKESAFYTKTITKNGTYKVTATDSKGNTLTKTINVTHFDSSAPKVSASVKGNAVTITVSDDVELDNLKSNELPGFFQKKLSGKKQTLTFKNTKKGKYTIKVTDAVGRTATTTFTVK